MTNLFISYSRKDKSFAEKLVGCFVEQQTDVWIDWEGIPPSTDWWNEIKKGIEEADVFIFLVSPDSIVSRVCAEEVIHAVKNGKRLIPVVVRDVAPKDVPPEISRLNWIFLRENDSFDTAFKKLNIAIHTDFEWVQIHRETQVKALKWERQVFENSLLLRGKELNDTEKYFASKQGVDPKPTALQQNFILKSRQFAIRQQRLLRGTALAILVIFIGIFSFLPIRNAIYRWKALNLGPTVPIDAGPAKIGDNQLAEIDSALTERSEDLDGYDIEIHEVTYERYSLCVDAGRCTSPNGTFDKDKDARKPVAQVTVKQAMEFCSWIDRRLPNELEWERAARSAEGWKWPWSNTTPPTDNLHANLNYERENPALVKTNEVGSAQAGKSTEGVLDLIGNVWEWTCTPDGEEPDTCWMDPSSPSIPAAFMIRGGGAATPAGPALVSAYREGAEWDNNISPFIGFRCVESP